VSRTLISLAVFLALSTALPAQESDSDPVSTDDLVSAAANMAATFSRTAPGLAAREVLHQHGRRGIVSILQAKNTNVQLPQEFRTHEVVSDYAFGQIGSTHAIHEIRSILTIDGRVISSADEARHALAIGVQSPDDELKHRLLENFERNRLEGAVTDFGQLLLLFSAASEKNYSFTPGHKRMLHNEPLIALNYKQVSGSDGLTVFHEHAMDVRTTEGEIWFRVSDLVPLRITMYTEKTVSGKLTIRDTAVVDYTPTEFGLAPEHVDHMQFLGSDLLVENDLQYSGYQRLTPGLAP
jgi:hypothetical protein